MSNTTLPAFWQKFTGPDGKPLSGGKLYFFVAGSTTVPKAVYSDHENTNPITQPVVLDASGLAPQYFAESGLYCIVLKDAVGALVATRDYVESPASSGSATGDHKIALAADDANPGYALEKIKEGDGIQVTGVMASQKYLRITCLGLIKVSSGGNMRYLGTAFADTQSVTWSISPDSISANVSDSWVQGLATYKVCCDAEDIDAPGYLIEKLVSTTLLITSESSGPHKQIHIETLTDPGEVAYDAGDAQALKSGYLGSKLRAGSGITLTVTEDATAGKVLWINSKANSWLPVWNTNASYTVKDTDSIINCVGPSVTVTLPDPGTTYQGRTVRVVACGIGVNVTMTCPSGSSLLVGATASFSNYATREVTCLAGASGWVWVLRA